MYEPGGPPTQSGPDVVEDEWSLQREPEAAAELTPEFDNDHCGETFRISVPQDAPIVWPPGTGPATFSAKFRRLLPTFGLTKPLGSHAAAFYGRSRRPLWAVVAILVAGIVFCEERQRVMQIFPRAANVYAAFGLAGGSGPDTGGTASLCPDISFLGADTQPTQRSADCPNREPPLKSE